VEALRRHLNELIVRLYDCEDTDRVCCCIACACVREIVSELAKGRARDREREERVGSVHIQGGAKGASRHCSCETQFPPKKPTDTKEKIRTKRHVVGVDGFEDRV
jgi:hypothetical protein